MNGTDYTFDGIAQWIASADWTTQRDCAVFYCGWSEERPAIRYGDEAPKLAALGPRCIIEVDAGRELQAKIDAAGAAEQLTEQEKKELWQLASAKFAEAASGHVLLLSDEAKPHYVFIATELPILLNNDKVTDINGVPRKTLCAIRDAMMAEAEGKAMALEEERRLEKTAMLAAHARISNGLEAQERRERERAIEQHNEIFEREVGVRLQERTKEEAALRAARRELVREPMQREAGHSYDNAKSLEEEREAERQRKEIEERARRLARELEEMRQRMLRQQSEQQSAGHSHSLGHGY